MLTANIGTLLDLYGVEKGLDHFRSAQELSFEEFRLYLQQEVFGSLPNTLALPLVREYEAKISEVSLQVSSDKVLPNENNIIQDVTEVDVKPKPVGISVENSKSKF